MQEVITSTSRLSASVYLLKIFQKVLIQLNENHLPPTFELFVSFIKKVSFKFQTWKLNFANFWSTLQPSFSGKMKMLAAPKKTEAGKLNFKQKVLFLHPWPLFIFHLWYARGIFVIVMWFFSILWQGSISLSLNRKSRPIATRPEVDVSKIPQKEIKKN